MPVKVYPASHEANKISSRRGFAETPMDVLQAAWPSSRFNELLQSSFTEANMPRNMDPSTNGFAYSIVNAYCYHHHLRIRPDDIWFAILTQLSVYINAHAEELRGKFVAHEGQEELVLTYGGDRYSMDFGLFAQDMTKLLETKVVDPDLRDWMMPGFTTTTREDKIVASILMMGSLQKYFKYTCCLMCGIPSVTLLGEKEDYTKILHKLEKLSEFGKETAQFQALLTPVLSNMIKTFDDPKSPEILDFWSRIMHRHSGGSGPTYYSGWMTAFCFWDEEGKCMYGTPGANSLQIDGVRYHRIDSDDVPPGWGKVPVKVNDNGNEIETEMVAGSVGIQCIADDNNGDETFLDTMQPQSGWWIYAMATGEHPDLANLRARAKARGLSDRVIEDLVKQSQRQGKAMDDNMLDFYAQRW